MLRFLIFCMLATKGLAQSTDCEMDIAIALDGSGSIEVDQPPDKKGNWALVIAFLRDFLSNFNVGLNDTRVGLVRFDTDTYLEWTLDQYSTKADVLAATSRLTYNPEGGTTNTDGALRRIINEVYVSPGDRPEVQNVLIIITDGQPTSYLNTNLNNTLNELKGAGVRILAIGVTDGVQDAFMRTIVTNPETDYIGVGEFAALASVVNNIIVKSCPVEPPVRDCLMDLALVVDRSGSIEKDNPIKGNWALVQAFLADLVANLNVGPNKTLVATVTFDDTGDLQFNLNDGTVKSNVISRLRTLPYFEPGGRTNTNAGLSVARNQVFVPSAGDRGNAVNVVLLFTDGKPTPELNAGLDATVRGLKSDGVRILGVGVTNDVNMTQMLQIVTNPQTDYFSVQNFTQLNQILNEIVNQTCQPEIPQPSDCGSPSDIFMVLDGSGSIDEINFRRMKTFAKLLVDEMNLAGSVTRLGLVMISNNSMPLFGLTEYTSGQAVKDRLDNIAYPRGTTNTAGVINYVRTQGFTANAGDRAGVPNVMVIFTDGSSTTAEETMREAYLAKKAGIHIIVVGIGNPQWLNLPEIKTMVSYPWSTNYIHVRNYTMLTSAVALQLRDLFCNNANECQPNPCVTGTCVDSIGTYTCQCPSGRGGRNCNGTCRDPADLTFILDSSSSMGPANFFTEIEFAQQVVMGLNTNSDSRVASVKFASTSEIQFRLDEYSTTLAIVNALPTSYMGGTTNMAAALQNVRTVNTGTSNRHKIAVIITDGKADNFTRTWAEATATHDEDVTIFGVLIGDGVDERQMFAVVSEPPPPHIFRVANVNQLSTVVSRVVETVCDNIHVCEPNPCQNGGTCIDEIYGFDCECLPQFSGHFCERRCPKLYDFIFALDTSGSIRHERFPLIIEFIARLLENFEFDRDGDDARAGAVSFSDDAHIEFQLNKYRYLDDVVTALRLIPYRGGRTNIAAALQQIEQSMMLTSNGHRANAHTFVILFTDGESTVNPEFTIPRAISLRRSSKIMVIPIGTSLNMLEIRGIASTPYDRMIVPVASATTTLGNVNASIPISNAIVAGTCNSVDECSPNPCANGAVCVDDFHTYNCLCTTGFSGRNCSRSCSAQMDVTIVLDFSGSLDQVIEIMIAFASELTEGLTFAAGRARVSVISYSDTAEVNFYLNQYTTKIEVLNALAFRRYGGRTNTQSALQLMYSDVFTAERGDRAGVRNVAIVVTDGGSNIQRDQTIVQAQRARSNGIEVYAAAAYRAPDMGEVNGIASDPDSEHVVLVPDAASVSSAVNRLLDLLCA